MKVMQPLFCIPVRNILLWFQQYNQLSASFLIGELWDYKKDSILPAAGAARRYFMPITRIKTNILHGILRICRSISVKTFFPSFKPLYYHCFVLMSTIFPHFGPYANYFPDPPPHTQLIFPYEISTQSGMFLNSKITTDIVDLRPMN